MLSHPFAAELDARLPLGYGGRFYGVYPAVVSDIVDPDGQGRVKVRLPWSPDTAGDEYAVWARLATMMAGDNRGSWFIPDVGDEVLIGFESGDPRRPYVLGMLWNGQDRPPEVMDPAGRNFRKTIRSRNGVRITLDDTDGNETLTLVTPGGQTIVLTDGARSIEARDSNGNRITMDPAGITVIAPTKVTVETPLLEVTATTVQASASIVTVDAPMTQFSGIVQADTVITNQVVSSSYTNGRGNKL